MIVLGVWALVMHSGFGNDGRKESSCELSPETGWIMLEVYRKVLTLFDARERRRFSWVMVIMIGVALAELVSMSAVLMLLGVLAQPDRITTNSTLQGLYLGLGFTSTYSFQLFLAGITFIAVAGSLVLRAGGSYVINRFSAMRSYSLSRRLLTAYLHRSYSWFLTQNSADMTRTVLQEADQIVQRVVVPGLRLASNGLVVLVIVGFLLVIDPLIMILTAAAARRMLCWHLSSSPVATATSGPGHDDRERRAVPPDPGGGGRLQGSQAVGARGRLCPSLRRLCTASRILCLAVAASGRTSSLLPRGTDLCHPAFAGDAPADPQ